jgi:hypothetical protein
MTGALPRIIRCASAVFAMDIIASIKAKSEIEMSFFIQSQFIVFTIV